MSKLEELIKELCPDGVEYRKIKDVYNRLRGTPITAGKMKEIACDDGEIRVFAGGKTVIDAHEKDIPKANIIRVPAVLVQSRGVIDAVYYDKPFTFKNEMWAYTADDTISVKFLYYVLKNNIQLFRDAASGMGSLPQISLKVTEEFRLPIPPLPIQEEIVRILDSFTELTAELTARKKQYESYRNKLFEELGVGVEYKTLGEIEQEGLLSMGRGQIISKKEMQAFPGDYPVYSSAATADGKIGSYGKYMFDDERITWSVDGGGKLFYRNGLRYSVTNVGGWLKVNNKNVLNTKYLYHCLINQWKDKVFDYTRKAHPSVIRNEYTVPIPPLIAQKEIVAKLDRFDSLCNDISSGLPAEIEARQKQYEYYRDKLLTFKELPKETA